jgi:hypothetical protein
LKMSESAERVAAAIMRMKIIGRPHSHSSRAQ